MKRGHEDEQHMEEPVTNKAKVDGEGSDVAETRFIIEKRSMGLIIGKGGSRITQLREETGVFASILKLKDGSGDSPERILVLKGANPAIVQCMKQICDIQLSNAQEREEKNNTGKPVPTGSKVTILFDQTQAGAVIGKGGTTIKETQTNSGARMQVSKDALPGSSERTATITGEVDQVENALGMVLDQLSQYPTNSRSQLYVPGSNMAFPDPYAAYGQQAPQAAAYGGGGGYGNLPGMGQNMGMYGQAEQQYGAPAASVQPIGTPGGQQKQQIAIPTTCAGGVIGKGGSRIREIQGQSQTIIQIAPVDTTNPSERIVSITGSTMGIQTAIAYIRQAVETEYRPPTAQY